MQSEKILELEIQLLIVKYGYRQIIKSLALIQTLTPENIEEQISKLKDDKIKKSKPKQLTIEEIASNIASEVPHISTQIHQIGIKFDNKTFLPQLKDVRRFIEKQSNKPIVLKNRLLGAKQVFNILKNMSKQDLEELIETAVQNKSDFSLLSEQLIEKKSK